MENVRRKMEDGFFIEDGLGKMENGQNQHIFHFTSHILHPLKW
jgi:hypothetical protein